MALDIKLDSPERSIIGYVAGDKVAGRVVLNSGKDEAVGSIQITFFGRANTMLYRETGGPNSSIVTYRGRANLFRFTRTLYSGHFTLRANEYCWPFEFEFPSNTLDCPQDTSWKPLKTFDTHPGHALPYTFSDSCRGSRYNSYDCFVEYGLKASLTRPSKSHALFSQGFKCTKPFFYLPLRDSEISNCEPVTMRKEFSHASFLLLPMGERPSGFKKISSLFRTLPKSTFTIYAEVPQVIYPDRRIPIYVGLEHALERSTAPEPPSVELLSLCVKLVGTTLVRAPAAWWGDKVSTSEDLFIFEDRKGLTVPMTEHMDLRDHYCQYGPNGSPIEPIFHTRLTCEPFSTYNICRSYGLEVTMIVQCADKEIAANFRSEAIKVLPGLYHVNNSPPFDRDLALLGRLREKRMRGISGTDNAEVGGPADKPPQYEPRSPGNTTTFPGTDIRGDNLSEKQRMHLAEKGLLPSQPPPDSGPSSSNTAAPLTPEEDEEDLYSPPEAAVPSNLRSIPDLPQYSPAPPLEDPTPQTTTSLGEDE